MFGLMRAARNMKPSPRRPDDKWYHVLGEALLIACMPVVIMLLAGLMFWGTHLFFEEMSKPPICTCEMARNHECVP